MTLVVRCARVGVRVRAPSGVATVGSGLRGLVDQRVREALVVDVVMVARGQILQLGLGLRLGVQMQFRLRAESEFEFSFGLESEDKH